MPASSPALHVEHEKLHSQLQELAGLRQELQALYEKTHAELQATRSEAALERGLREAASADNAALRKWNAQLGEELSALLAHLQQEEDEAALDSGSAAAVAASSQLSSSALSGVGVDGGEASGLSRANAEVLARLVRLRHSGTRHEQQVSQRLLARLMASGEPMLQHEVERLTREQEALPRPPAAAETAAAAAASATAAAAAWSAASASPPLHGGAPRVRAIDGTPAADLAAAQQLELELAAATVRNTSVHARLRRTQEDLRAAVQRSSELHAGSEQLLADLTQATQRIAALEERIGTMDEEQRRRDSTARQLLERRVQQSAEMEAALQAHAHARLWPPSAPPRPPPPRPPPPPPPPPLLLLLLTHPPTIPPHHIVASVSRSSSSGGAFPSAAAGALGGLPHAAAGERAAEAARAALRRVAGRLGTPAPPAAADRRCQGAHRSQWRRARAGRRCRHGPRPGRGGSSRAAAVARGDRGAAALRAAAVLRRPPEPEHVRHGAVRSAARTHRHLAECALEGRQTAPNRQTKGENVFN